MATADAVSTGALLLMLVIALVLLIQYLKLQNILQIILDCKTTARRAKTWEMENKELHSALRAEKEHVEQLRRKLELLQVLIPVH